MNQKLFILLLTLLGLNHLQAQQTEWGIRFSGFVKTDVFYDTRQSSASNGIREGHFFLFPDNVLYDSSGTDLNANPSLHILSIQTRLRGDIIGTDAFGAKTSGAIEGEFFGTSDNDLNGFRLRHAYVRLDWTSTSLLVGQFWHPMFPAENFPGTISFNTGAPFTPFSRNPQLRLNKAIGSGQLSLTAYAQRDFSSAGPDGMSNKYMRNSKLPGLNLQGKIPFGEMFTAWIGADYKTLRPELRTASFYATHQTIASMAAFLSIKIKTKPLNASFMGVYGQNATDLMMLGGYAVSKVLDTLKLEKEYTSINTLNILTDLSTTGKKYSFGLFAGYSKNLGASEDIIGPVYGRGTNIDHLIRVSPRMMMTSGKLSFAFELESTLAAYGKMQKTGKVTETETVNNLRILLSSIYRF